VNIFFLNYEAIFFSRIDQKQNDYFFNVQKYEETIQNFRNIEKTL